MLPTRRITMGSLFSGIAGLELGLAAAFEEAGFEVEIKWQVEQDPDCRAVLQKHYPTVDRSITDVRIASRANLVRVGLICGGFPCQDVSGAGKGAGLAGARSGLWFEFLRIVSELHPPLVIVENVASGAKRWLCRVRADLHALGYRTRAIALSAADVGAPHLRRRIFIIAVADAMRAGLAIGEGEREEHEQGDGAPAKRGGGERALPDPIGEQLREQPGRCGWTNRTGASEPGDDVQEPGRLPQSSVGRVPDGLPRGLDAHRWPAPRGQEPYAWEPSRTIEGKQVNRRARIKALGNAVSPQCGLVIGRMVVEMINE